MDFAKINPHLSERRSGSFERSVGSLQDAVAGGMVPNKLFVDVKDIINRAIDEAAEAFLKSGPHVKGRNGQAHHQSDWWIAAYDANAFAGGAHVLPAALKRAKKSSELDAYAEFLSDLMPLRELLEAAKPLIKKRGELPKVRSAKEIAEDAKRMVCQCCERRIFAELGSIAHHGYERPGYGWQSPSCMGAKRLPFEVDRSALGEMIEILRARLASQVKHRAAIKAEKKPIVFNYEEYLIGPVRGFRNRWDKWPVVKRSFDVSRKSFAEFKAGPGSNVVGYSQDYEAYKAEHVAYLSGAISNLKRQIDNEQARFDGWVQSHEWKGGKWVALKKEKVKA